MCGPCPDRYPAIMYDLSAVGISAAQESEQISRMMCKGSVDLPGWHQLPKQQQPDFKTKGDKRNGTMSRQQAFGGLFK